MKVVSVLNRVWDRGEYPFLEENFGFVASSFSYGPTATSFPALFTPTTVITPDALADKRQHKDKNAIYETDPDEILRALCENPLLVPLSMLSDMYSVYLESYRDTVEGGINVVAGDSTSDRLLYWNGHNRFSAYDWKPNRLTSLRIPEARLNDEVFLAKLATLLTYRGRSDGGGMHVATLCSSSLDRDVLEKTATTLRDGRPTLSVKVEQVADHSACVPKCRNPENVRYSTGRTISAGRVALTEEFSGNRFRVPQAVPWHLAESSPPSALRDGNWMVDLAIQRTVDHAEPINIVHSWVFPRRLRIDNAFRLERRPEDIGRIWENFKRPVRTGELSLALRAGLQSVAITVPDDRSAIFRTLCDSKEWRFTFDAERAEPRFGRDRLYDVEVSDKGRYLLGVLGRFEDLPSAFRTLLHGYWREVLQLLSGSSAGRMDEVISRFTLRVRRKLGRPTEPIRLDSKVEESLFAEEALAMARSIAREQRYIRYGALFEKWRKKVDAFIDERGYAENSEEALHYRDVQRLDGSIQFLCERGILFQGREWRCPSCYNRNWIGIEAMGQMISCSVCSRQEAAPVSGDWHFRGNSFVLEAYREHGTEALIWALNQLWDDPLIRSFYFASSFNLWIDRPTKAAREPDAEIDGIAVVDGRVFAIEATTSKGLSKVEIEKLVRAMERIRPDVLYVVCAFESDAAARKLAKALADALPNGVEPEVRKFNPAKDWSGLSLPGS